MNWLIDVSWFCIPISHIPRLANWYKFRKSLCECYEMDIFGRSGSYFTGFKYEMMIRSCDPYNLIDNIKINM